MFTFSDLVNAYQVSVAANQSGTMVLDGAKVATSRQIESGMGLRTEVHTKPAKLIKNGFFSATNYRVSSLGIYPDVINFGMGAKINVDFLVDIKTNNPNNRAAFIIVDTTITPWKYIAQINGVQKEHHTIELTVGRQYRVETTAQAYINEQSMSSTVVQVNWALPDEPYYTNVGNTYATVCPTVDDDGNNGHGNDSSKVDLSNPGKSKY